MSGGNGNGNGVGHVSPRRALFRPRDDVAVRIGSAFLGRSTSATPLCVGKKKGRRAVKASMRAVFCNPRAVAASLSSKLAKNFKLDTNSELEVTVHDCTSRSPIQIEFKVSNTSGSLVLHWGVIHQGRNDWSLPSCHPERTQLYNNEALRTAFTKLGSISSLKLEIEDPEVQFVEFLILDEAANKWIKNNGQNFRVQLLEQDYQIQHVPVSINPNVAVPEDLVQVQAYVRWERKGRQTYTPEQEKIEFEESRRELQLELDKGTSLDQLRENLLKRDTSKTSSHQLEAENYSSNERIHRNKMGITEILNKNVAEILNEKITSISKVPTVLELWSKSIQEQEGELVLYQKVYKLDNMDLRVLAIESLGRKKVYLATDDSEPLILHWGLLSRKAGEWMIPPSSAMPSGSVLLEKACETPFTKGFIEDQFYQAIQIEIDGDDHIGMPFVLRSDDKWIKNHGFDFYFELDIRSIESSEVVGDGKGTAKSLLDRIIDLEAEAQRSLMHRFNIAADLTEEARDVGLLGFAGILVWLRFMAMRQLIWNKNYNVKPREISQAQDRLTDLLQNIYKDSPQYREILRMIMSCIGRGGEGDFGQRIRDEILVIQRNNACEGGMVEEWHQKLHNNTSPDDVVICQALIDYIKSDLDISVYWGTLNKNGITKERLLSYDHAIHSEPSFRANQKEGLLRDLGNYMRTLKAVHSGADLESAITTCMGYKAEGQGFMVGVQKNPIRGLPSGFSGLMEFILKHVEDKVVEPLIEGLMEARVQLRPLLLNAHERMKDLIFLDIALDSTVRTVIERSYEELKNAGPEKIIYLISLLLENLALSTDDNEDLIYCLKGWNHAMELRKQKDNQWALFSKSFLDRTRLSLSSKAEYYHQILQPSAEYLGSCLGVDRWAVSIFTEEIIRAGSAASLSTLVNRFDPILRTEAHLGSWQVISPVEVAGYVEVVDALLAVQNKSYTRPTILIAKSVKGEEEIPDGTVAVLTPDMPDVLSHVSVRARNSKVCFATCFDANIFSELQRNEGKLFGLKPTSGDIVYSEIEKSELEDMSTDEQSSSSVTLVKKHFGGKYAISAEEFTSEMVGAKSRNIAFLKGKVPSWMGIPTSVALPFGVFEKVLSNDANKEIASKLQFLKDKLVGGEFDVLIDIRETILQLEVPIELVISWVEPVQKTVPPMSMVQELKEKMQASGMPWPGDEGEHRWEHAWTAIKRVWASKWNERAYFSTRKVKLDHDWLCMAVLVQQVISADYAFVIHTTNPSSGDSSEIYAEVVKGLGETLVGAYPGRALSFVCKKNNLNSPKVLGYPSKPTGLFIRSSIIFRSDSNGEDLEGYAGAGLYDSVPMDEEEKVILDYVADPLVMDKKFQNSLLSSIARAGHAIEELYGSPQDIEGVVKDGKIFVVQTRPQM